jgi:hypothetical protein
VSLILPIHAVSANWSVDESYPQDITVIMTTMYSLFLSYISAQALCDHSGLTHYVTETRANNSMHLGRLLLIHIFFLLRELVNITERSGKVVNAHSSYSGVPGFIPPPRQSAMLIEGFRRFTQSLQANAGIYLKLRHYHFLLNPFPFIIIHLSPYHRL